MSAEWAAVGISAVVAIMSVVQLWTSLNIKLTIAKVRSEISDVKLWTHDNFVSKKDHLDMLGLWTSEKR